MNVIKDENHYSAIFSGDMSKHPLKMYGCIVRMLMEVDEHFRTIKDLRYRTHRNNLKYHVLMVLSWSINGERTLPAERIVQLDMSKLQMDLVERVTKHVFDQFEVAGAEDRVAKEGAFTEQLKIAWDDKKLT